MSFFYKPYTSNLIQMSLQSICKQARAAIKYSLSTKSTRKEFCKKRAFCSASLPGLMTVEAAIILPLFLLAVMSILNLIHMVGVNESIHTAMARTAHPTAVYGYEKDFSEDQLYPLLFYQLSTSDINFSSIYGGIAGISYQDTSYDPDTGELTISLNYGLKPAFSLFQYKNIRARQRIYTRTFIGGKLLSDNSSAEDSKKTMVYVAENGMVYHRSRSCAYIDISFHMVGSAGVGDLRNLGGAKYYPCELCMGHNSPGSMVYITDTGNRYHASSACSGLKRTVYEMVLTEDCILPPCSRCGH